MRLCDVRRGHQIACPKQIDAQIPYEAPVDTELQLPVKRSNVLSVPQQIVVAKAQPGILAVNQTGRLNSAHDGPAGRQHKFARFGR